MESNAYTVKLEELADSFADYRVDAYFFIADAVKYTIEQMKRDGGEVRHVTGRELLDGFRDLALQRYGALALDVVTDWGLKHSEDVGAVVFRMVENGLLGADKRDSPDDFTDGFDFRNEFLAPFDAPHPHG